MKARDAGGMEAELKMGLCDRWARYCPLEEEDCDEVGYVFRPT